MKVVISFKDLHNILMGQKEDLTSLYNEMSELDLKMGKILHIIENIDISEHEGKLMLMEMKKIRIRRRDVKNQISKITRVNNIVKKLNVEDVLIEVEKGIEREEKEKDTLGYEEVFREKLEEIVKEG